MRYQKRRKNRKLKLLIFLSVLIIAGLAWLKFGRASLPTSTQNQQPGQNMSDAKEQVKPPVVEIQSTIDSWASKQTGKASVVVIDLVNSKFTGSLNPDSVYFSASIYKLYVAYIGYQKVADGTYKMEDPYLAGYSRGKCLDEMIRSSYSPCGEKMWDELGKEEIGAKLKTYGLKNTNMVGLQTSANDAAIILQRLFDNKDLTPAHRDLFLDSLKNQPSKFRVGLPSGFSKSTAYNKVGWNEQLEWHDTAIVTLPNGRSYVVSVLTRSVGRAQVVELAKQIEAKLNQ